MTVTARGCAKFGKLVILNLLVVFDNPPTALTTVGTISNEYAPRGLYYGSLCCYAGGSDGGVYGLLETDGTGAVKVSHTDGRKYCLGFLTYFMK